MTDTLNLAGSLAFLIGSCIFLGHATATGNPTKRWAFCATLMTLLVFDQQQQLDSWLFLMPFVVIAAILIGARFGPFRVNGNHSA